MLMHPVSRNTLQHNLFGTAGIKLACEIWTRIHTEQSFAGHDIDQYSSLYLAPKLSTGLLLLFVNTKCCPG